MEITSIVFYVVQGLLIVSALISMSIGLKKKDEKSLSAMVSAFSLMFVLAIVFSAIQGLDYFKLVEFERLPSWSSFNILSMVAFLYLASSVFTNYWTFEKKSDRKKEI